MRAQLSKEGTKEYYLAGFENNGGKSCRFNFIANNGQRTEQKSDYPMQDFMMPETCKQTRKVEVYCNCIHLCGFKFFDINNTLLFEVGLTAGTMTPVLIAADEQIIGVKAKVYHPNQQAIYTDFQFMVCKRV